MKKIKFQQKNFGIFFFQEEILKTEITTSEPVPIRKARSVKEIATKFHSQPITITTEVKLQSQEMVFIEFSAEFRIFFKLTYIFGIFLTNWEKSRWMLVTTRF